MPAGIEVFGNQPTATITAGGTTTSDTAFTVTATNSWPAASTSTTPNTFFHIVDAANTSEIMLVTVSPGGSGSGQSWTVARAQEGTTGISHSANWTAVQLVTAGTLQNFKQASTAATSPVTVGNTLTETVIATFQPVTSDIVAGTTFHAEAFGTLGTSATAADNILTWNLRWGGVGGTSLLTMVTGTSCPVLGTSLSGRSFDVNGSVVLLSSTSAVANINFWWQLTATTTATGVVSAATGTTISGSGPLVLTAKWGAVAIAGSTLTVPAPFILRVA